MDKTKLAKKCTASATTTLGAMTLCGVNINKTLVGTVTVQEGATALGQFAIGTTPGPYWFTEVGVGFANLQVVLSGADDVTLFITSV